MTDKLSDFNEDFFRLITDNSSDIILIVDSQAVIKYISQAVERYLGYRPQELMGKSGFDLIYREDIPRAINDFRTAIQEKKPAVPNSFRVLHKDGSMRFFEGLGKNLLDDPVVAGFVMNIRDVTDRKRIEDALSESEERNRTITENTSDLIAMLSFELFPKYLYVSPSHEIVTGYKSDELVGKSALEFVHPQDYGKVSSVLKVYVAEKTKKIIGLESKPWHENLDYRIKAKNGNLVYLESTADLVGDRIVLVSRDITKRKNEEEALRLEKERAQKYLDVAGVILLVLNSKGEVTLINKKGCEVLECSEKEALGSNWFDTFILEEEKGKVSSVFAELMSGKIESSEFVENPVLTRKRRIKKILWHNIILRDDAGKICGTISSGEDVTERKKAEARVVETSVKLNDVQEQLVQAAKMEAIGRIASGIAHEVRNPLGIILQGVNYLEDKVPTGTKEVSDVIYMIKNSIDRADSIICALVDFSRTAVLDLRSESVNMILEDSLVLVKHELVLNKIVVVKDLGENLPRVLVDRGRMEQVFINLLLNGIQSMGRPGKLFIRTYSGMPEAAGSGCLRVGDTNAFVPDRQVVFVQIKDSGTGISQEDLYKIFEPFFTTKAPGEGTGLGLSVTRNIIDMHKGFIDVESTQEKGTKVTVALRISDKEE